MPDPTPRIRLFPEEKPAVRRARLPMHRALLWQPVQVDGQQAEPAVQVFVTQRAYIRACAYAGTDLQNETGGWLLGKHRRDVRSGVDFIVVDTVLSAENTRYGSTYLTFTQDSMVSLNQVLEDDYPRKQLVGWFHTHPRMGVFFSSWDHWLHENFFPQPWQVALVIEPYSFTGGFFIKTKDGTLDTRKYYGFYELTGQDKRSVMLWRNMEPGRVPLAGQGGLIP